jgi:DNA gyrase/topoisomerase IV subunit A
MQYHPHGDASIGMPWFGSRSRALICKNWGMYIQVTVLQHRYIETRLSKFALIIYNLKSQTGNFLMMAGKKSQ